MDRQNINGCTLILIFAGIFLILFLIVKAIMENLETFFIILCSLITIIVTIIMCVKSKKDTKIRKKKNSKPGLCSVDETNGYNYGQPDKSNENILYYKDTNSFTNASKYTKIIFLKNIKYSPWINFSQFKNLEEIEFLSEEITIIPEGFKNCKKLRKVILSEKALIGHNAFEGCNNLEYNTYDNGMYLGSKSNPYLCLIKLADYLLDSIEINNKTEVVCDRALQSSHIKSLIVPNSVKYIGCEAFALCENLTEIRLPDKLKTLTYEHVPAERRIADLLIRRYGVFQQCYALKQIVLPDGIDTIGFGMFMGCKSLERVHIPRSIKVINTGAFNNCEALKELIIPEDYDSKLSANCLQGLKSLEIIHIPKNQKRITAGFLKESNDLKAIYYHGTKEQWDTIKVTQKDNKNLIKAKLYCLGPNNEYIEYLQS